MSIQLLIEGVNNCGKTTFINKKLLTHRRVHTDTKPELEYYTKLYTENANTSVVYDRGPVGDVVYNDPRRLKDTEIIELLGQVCPILMSASVPTIQRGYRAKSEEVPSVEAIDMEWCAFYKFFIESGIDFIFINRVGDTHTGRLYSGKKSQYITERVIESEEDIAVLWESKNESI